MKRALFSTLLMAVLSAQAATLPIITLTDARGDDHGDGRLVYPQQGEYESGDLDLQTLKISRDMQGFWFEATFQNQIRNPANVSSSVGSESLAEFARRGFYQFNLDVYIDTDRVKGSGNTFTLPGRQVRIDAGYAWERAVILSPRPEAARAQLLDILSQQYPNHTVSQIEAGIDPTIFFPTQIKVQGRTISFFVPTSFIGSSDGKDWAVTAFVTAAQRSSELKLSRSAGEVTPFNELNLGVMQPQVGHPRDAVGYGSGANKPSPIFDILSRSAAHQKAMLSSGAPIKGASWGPRAADETAVDTVSAHMTEAAPTTNVKPDQVTGKKSFLSNPVEYVRGMFQEEPKSSAAVVAIPAQTLLDPNKPNTNPLPAPTGTPTQPPAPAAAPNPPIDISKRLQSLQQLLNDKVINEAEYKQQRLRILNEL
jgi:hypothetical protein